MVELCSGDLSFSATKCFDLEVWSPAEKTYLEVSSCSNFEDFQARRSNIRFRKQSNGKITHLIACSGTGGTISGIARYLKEKNSKIKIIGVDAYGSVLKKYHETGEFDEKEIFPYRITGLGKSINPSVTDFKIIDKYVKVNDEDSAHSAREIVKNEGIFVGYTSGAAFQAIKQLNREGEFKKDDKIVVIFPDHGSKYLSKIYNDKWMEKQGFFNSKHEST